MAETKYQFCGKCRSANTRYAQHCWVCYNPLKDTPEPNQSGIPETQFSQEFTETNDGVFLTIVCAAIGMIPIIALWKNKYMWLILAGLFIGSFLIPHKNPRSVTRQILYVVAAVGALAVLLLVVMFIACSAGLIR